MKTHAIIPVFIPHRGCPHDCIFCNQKKITAQTGNVTIEDIDKTVSNYLSTFRGNRVELAFYGGSFTGLPIDEQIYYLNYAKNLKTKGIISGIHMSTRPDYINEDIIEIMREYHVDTCELGVQSFDDKVLTLSQRGHKAKDAYEASKLIKAAGIRLGIQLMIGLPGDTYETCIFSAKETASLSPELARLYPTIIIEDTELYELYMNNKFMPLDEEEVLLRTKNMYRILTEAGVYIMRIGLKSTELINNERVIGPYHPAFGSKVKSEVMGDLMELSIKNIPERLDKSYITFYSNSKSFSDLVGYAGCNKARFKELYPHINFGYGVDNTMPDGERRAVLGKKREFKRKDRQNESSNNSNR